LLALWALESDAGAVAMVGWDLLLAIAFAVDAVQLPRVSDLSAERSVRAHLLHGVEDEVRIRVRASRPGRAVVIAGPPAPVVPRDVVELPRTVALIPRGTAEVAYPIRPRRRGRAVFGRVNVLVDGPLRLARRRIALDAGGAIEARVYPNVGDIDKGALDPKLM